jgi:hypothetical protein
MVRHASLRYRHQGFELTVVLGEGVEPLVPAMKCSDRRLEAGGAPAARRIHRRP